MEQLNQSFFYTLEKAIKSYRKYFQSQLKNAGFEITLDQWLVLNMIIDFEGITQTEIAERVFKDKGSITRIIDLLEINGYVVRMPHPTHGKMSQLDITEKGKSTLENLKKEVPKFRDFALRTISDESKKDTQDILKIIINNCIH
jgi:MarR family transcriptional regulator, transcriptional regulator for hemolysin